VKPVSPMRGKSDESVGKRLVIDGEIVRWYDFGTVTSTMDYAADLVREGTSRWTLVTAQSQTAGRGTHGRDWLSIPGKGLYLSLVLPLPVNTDGLENLSLRTAETLTDALCEYYSLDFVIKSPNDVLVRGKKVAGILYESVSHEGRILSLILGMGVNLHQTRDDFERGGLPDATSLFIEAGFVPEGDELMWSFLTRYIRMYRNELCPPPESRTGESGHE